MNPLTLAAVLLLCAAAHAAPDRCSLKPDAGPCEALIPKYFFDQATRTCRKFNWGGCQGVVPFDTLADCNAAKCTTAANPCTLKPETGRCRARKIRYFFDQTTNSCRTFTWGGCGGVVPFTTAADCKAAKCLGEDPCTLKPEVGPCRASIPMYFFDQTTKKCKMFRWGGCKGVVPFKTAAECEASKCAVEDPCTLKPEVGPCRASIPRYFFDKTSKTCKMFRWGGCKGVAPFKTATECKAAQCSGQDPCTLKPEGGPCRASIPKYFFDQTSKTCKRFTWGGCKGVVPFQTAASCKAAQCSGSVGSTGTDPCMLKPARGLCKAYKPRYFWNASTNKCQRFIWGGCGGVVPFTSLTKCENAQCGTSSPNCKLAPETGRCRAAFRRYFFDQTTQTCKQFIWGGCGGVVPFKSAAACESANC